MDNHRAKIARESQLQREGNKGAKVKKNGTIDGLERRKEIDEPKNEERCELCVYIDLPTVAHIAILSQRSLQPRLMKFADTARSVFREHDRNYRNTCASYAIHCVYVSYPRFFIVCVALRKYCTVYDSSGVYLSLQITLKCFLA